MAHHQQGGHGNKGVMDQIKEKIPGMKTNTGGHGTGYGASTGAGTGTGYGGTAGQHYGGDHHHEKKGVVDQIKDKIPGMNTTTGGHHGTTTGGGTGTGYGGTAGQHYGGAQGDHHHHEKKGVVDQIKDKIPGMNTTGTGTGHGTTTGGTGHHGNSHDAYGGVHQKKGMMDKIKDKLPGGH